MPGGRQTDVWRLWRSTFARALSYGRWSDGVHCLTNIPEEVAMTFTKYDFDPHGGRIPKTIGGKEHEKLPMKAPRVSIVLPTYMVASTLERQLRVA